MKKFLFSILAAGAIVACTKSEVNYNDPSEIAFAPVATNASKAVVTGIAYPDNLPFNVFAFYAVGTEPGAVADYNQFTSVYLPNKKFVDKGDYYGGNPAYYWPKTGSLVFAGYSPSQDAIASDSQTYNFTDKLTITGFVQSEVPASTDDLMWFNQTAQSYRGGVVPVKFTHACSWLSFTVFSTAASANFHLKKLVLNEVQTKGDFFSDDRTWNLAYNVTKPVVVVEGDVAAPSAGDPLKVDGDNVIVLPQSCVSATITYTMDNGAGVTVEQTQTFPLTAGTDGGVWKLARHYTYNIQFGADEILISPALTKDWENIDAGLVSVN